MTGEIFISYRRSDQDKARLLHALLKQRGVDAWYDALVGAGEDWRQKTAEALNTAPIFVLLFSKVASESDDISKELAAATFSKKLVIPVRIDNIKPQGVFLYELASRNWFDAYENTEARFVELADQLAALVKGGPAVEVAAFSLGSTEPPPKIAAAAAPPLASPPSQAPWFKQPLVLGGIGALALAVIAGAVFMARGPATAAASPENYRIAVFDYTSDDDPAAKTAASMATEEAYRTGSLADLVLVARPEMAASGEGPVLDRAEKLGARFALEGDFRREGDKLRLTTRGVDVLTRQQIGVDFHTRLSVEDAVQVGSGGGASSIAWINCIVIELKSFGANEPDASAKGLMSQACTNRLIEAAPLRDLTKRFPDNPLLQAQFASALTYSLSFKPAAMRPGLLAESDAALAKAEKLAPDNYLTSNAHLSNAVAHDRPPVEWMPRAEADLQRQPSGEERYAYGVAASSLGQMLMALGRTKDAAFLFGAARTNDPNHRNAAYYVALSRAASNQYGVDDGFRAAMTANFRGFTWEITLVAAIFLDALDPEEVLKVAPESEKEMIPCYRDLITSLKASDPKVRLAGARRADPCLTKIVSPHINILAQSALGDLDRALVLIDRPDLTRSFWDTFPTLWFPAARALRADPRFLPVMQKLGYVDYWKESKTHPDICDTADERDIPLCKALR